MIVENVNKDELYYFLSGKLGTSAYVGIHGTATRGDIENEYTHLSKEDKAKNIMNIGLINARGKNSTLICKFFGILPLLSRSQNLKDRDQIYRLNTMSYKNGYDRGENGQVMIVVAIPIEFEKSNEKKYFGGWIGNQSSNSHYTSSYCFSDFIYAHAKKIPPECIYGYYTYTEENDQNVSFYYNEKYYSLLSQEEKDSFIERNFEQIEHQYPHFKMISKFATQDELEKDEHDINWNSLIQNDPYKQYADYTEIKKNNPQHKISHETYYSCEELENISLCDIDLSKIKPTYEDVLNGKYNIKHKILNQEICGTNLPHFVGLLTDSESFSIDEFEKEVQRCGNKPENLYRYWYTINKLYFDELYKRHIIELQEVENNKIKKDSTSIAKATKDVPIDEINIASNLLDEITNEISKKGETRNEPDN